LHKTFITSHSLLQHNKKQQYMLPHTVQRTQTATGQRSFAVNGPATWNRRPPALRSPNLKAHLFSTAQCHWDVLMILAPDINIQTYLLTSLATIFYGTWFNIMWSHFNFCRDLH